MLYNILDYKGDEKPMRRADGIFVAWGGRQKRQERLKNFGKQGANLAIVAHDWRKGDERMENSFR